MTAKFTAEDLLKITGGRIAAGSVSEDRGSICTEIDDLQAGQWFIALPSRRADGHDSLAEAAARGALGSVVVDRERYAFASPEATLIAVPSTLQALYQLASFTRLKVDPKVIAVTGSSGKSTTRDMCKDIASKKFMVHWSQANRPDAKNLALTILSMPDDCEVLVVELSQKGRGQISWLSSLLKPDIGAITNIGLAHLESLGSIENIAAAKCELLEGLSIGEGLAVLGSTDQHLISRASIVFAGGRCMTYYDSHIDEVAVTPENTLFSIAGSDTLFQINSHGSAYLRDAWCAIMCSRHLGMSDHDIAEGLRRYVPPRGRGNRLVTTSGAMLVDESHSATPDSVRAAVTAFLDRRAVPAKKKYIVLGEITELGETSESIHSKLGRWLSEEFFDCLITIGDCAAHISRGAQTGKFERLSCAGFEEVVHYLSGRLDEETAVLVDGSDSPELRCLVNALSRDKAA
ncbi:MAG: UDP-N-acetylmuramoyl-tripeptide--D-alanyl-D-alanine ligase [Candidatus Obscuribacterales bacterium]|nr:UDP-N-acetylmuramoyl-tripeptide--D-alanyl-D-alanine ligase [Candidatus Obscuribacterales bacterium]